MQCPECQFENREEAKFCSECGYKFRITCPKCRHKIIPESKFCDECGYDLRQFKDPPAIDYSEPQSYTPKFLADKILTNRSSIEGERKLVTVLFAEVANYTSISENGSIQRGENQCYLAKAPQNTQVPDTIHGIIAARMDRREDNLKHTMQVASVIGRDFTFRILQTITRMQKELKSYLLNLQGLEFIKKRRRCLSHEFVGRSTCPRK